MMPPPVDSRKGARSLASVPIDVRAALAQGAVESANLMEWLAADMAALARSIGESAPDPRVAVAMNRAAPYMAGAGILRRLQVAGAAIAQVAAVGDATFQWLSSHKSDLVRQWACYAANDPCLVASLAQRLEATLPFAADPNMSVREAAWMAFRPHLTLELERGIAVLEPLTRHHDPNVRRFSVEVCRPRSVWGAHLTQLKRDPAPCANLLENVSSDESRYVRLAVGNWLNDASKTRPGWVLDLCGRWSARGDKLTDFIVKRGLRTLTRGNASFADAIPQCFDLAARGFHSAYPRRMISS
jgi:3-methyladenine DNA glycosylase AlkC